LEDYDTITKGQVAEAIAPLTAKKLLTKVGNINNLGALDLKDKKLDNTIVNLTQGQSNSIADSPTNLFPSSIVNLQNNVDTNSNFFGYQLALGVKNEASNEQGKIYLRRISATGGLQNEGARQYSE
jgi:hypothetical protein